MREGRRRWSCNEHILNVRAEKRKEVKMLRADGFDGNARLG